MSETVFATRQMEPEEKKFWAAHQKTLREIDIEIAACKKRYTNTPGPHLNDIEWRVVQGEAAKYVWRYLTTRGAQIGIDNVRPLIAATVLDLALVEAGPKLAKIKGCRLPVEDEPGVPSIELIVERSKRS